ncbi:MAG: hypothetical protein CMQ05_12620 [Gammaproteobacteria bacterium]|nr:hypothetical protein [Gammaproteobacteria bacterium]RPG25212.1 MAG: DUF1722 domain-containing protein [Gammaproteobacteria bacterium TMED50]
MLKDVPVIGVSACLLGQQVRFDGNHKRDRYVVDVLGDQLPLESYCPEVAIGLGTPRAPIRLVNMGEDDVHAVGVEDPTRDVTEALRAYGRDTAASLAHLSGYVFKKDSPSCGVHGVRVYARENAPPSRTGRGLFASEVMRAFPELPVEEEGRLNDDGLRENFLTRVFTYHRWQRLVDLGITVHSLTQFHTRHKFLLLAHHEPGYRELGRIVASSGGRLKDASCEYIRLVMRTLNYPATPRKHANVLMHLMGHVKNELDAIDKQCLLDAIDQQRQGLVPLIVPLTMLKYFLAKFPTPYVDQQVYLDPHPAELMLRFG